MGAHAGVGHADDAVDFACSACVLLTRGHYIFACVEVCVEMRVALAPVWITWKTVPDDQVSISTGTI
ncbi:hypothetical protein Rhow_005604 [Rhodococcus wratislaviensis]|uniref:Uncharacterized protein n=1 Tax=Rhodococcus wratislaviensis TaxID=44752 RepID=A0A402CEC4_RHOWR|nr:hypothetical protein Rhow_005604 [Rhodococcus wratislaviensis]